MWDLLPERQHQFRVARNPSRVDATRVDHSRQRHLRRVRLLLFRDSAQQIHQRLIRFAVFWSEARDDGTEIGVIELGIFGDFASEEAPAERAEWNDPDP